MLQLLVASLDVGIYGRLGCRRAWLFWMLDHSGRMLDSYTDIGLAILMLKHLTREAFLPLTLVILIAITTAAFIEMAVNVVTILAPAFEAKYFLQTTLTVLACESLVLVTTAIALRRQVFDDLSVPGGEVNFLIMSACCTALMFLASLWSLRKLWRQTGQVQAVVLSETQWVAIAIEKRGTSSKVAPSSSDSALSETQVPDLGHLQSASRSCDEITQVVSCRY